MAFASFQSSLAVKLADCTLVHLSVSMRILILIVPVHKDVVHPFQIDFSPFARQKPAHIYTPKTPSIGPKVLVLRCSGYKLVIRPKYRQNLTVQRRPAEDSYQQDILVTI